MNYTTTTELQQTTKHLEPQDFLKKREMLCPATTWKFEFYEKHDENLRKPKGTEFYICSDSKHE